MNQLPSLSDDPTTAPGFAKTWPRSEKKDYIRPVDFRLGSRVWLLVNGKAFARLPFQLTNSWRRRIVPCLVLLVGFTALYKIA